jgi:dolichol-phosphate mannosyltransferase
MPTAEAASSPQLSIVVPLFNEEETLPELYRRVTAAMTQLAVSFELVLVNDGSRDSTPFLADSLQRRDPRVVVLHLTRNFGHQAAISAGIDHARGQAVVLMDGDLQDPPEVLGQFIEAWRAGNEVVYAIRTQRKEGLFKRTCYALFYRLFRFLSDLDVPLDSGDFCLMDRQVVDTLKALPERMRFVRGLRTFVGFRQVGLRYEREARHAGQPKYTLKALVRLAVDGLVSFSSYPLTLVTYMGLLSLFVAVGVAGYVLVDALHNHTAPRGWASLVMVVLFMSGVQLLSLGIIAEYIRRIFLETKGRPTYLVRRGSPAQAESTAEPISVIDARPAQQADYGILVARVRSLMRVESESPTPRQ